MVIVQGDVFWLDIAPPTGSEPGYRHPVVVIQNDRFNQSAIRTALVAVITSNLARAESPGNVLLAKSDANLPRRSVVNVSSIMTVDRNRLKNKVGTLSKRRVREIVEGLIFVIAPAT